MQVFALILAMSLVSVAALGEQNCTAQAGNSTLSLTNTPSATLVISGANISNVSYYFSLCVPTAYCNHDVFVAAKNNATGCENNQYFDGVQSLYASGDSITREFNSSASGSLRVTVRCNSSAPTALTVDPNTQSTTNDLYLVSATVCDGYKPASDDDPDDDSLNTGAIVGVVIGVVGAVILAAVVYQWRTKAKEDENYTQM